MNKNMHAVMTLLILVIFSVFTPILAQSLTAAEPPATAMHKKVDIFKGSFSPSDVSASPDEAFDVSFSICPTMDAPDTTIRFIVPASLIKLVKGDRVWRGDVKKGETVTLTLTFATIGEVGASVRAKVEASPSGKKYSSFYDLDIVTLKAEFDAEKGSLTRGVGPEAEILTRGVGPEAEMLAASPGTFRIKGRFLYVNEDGGNSPARLVRVEIWDSDSTSADDRLGSGWTDMNGYFDITVPNEDGLFAGTADPYVRFYAYDRYKYWVTKTGGGDTYWWRYPNSGTIRNNVPDGWFKDIGWRVTAASHRALQAGDACYEEGRFIWSWVSWQRSKRVTINWPEGTWPHCHGDSIHLPSTGWNHVTVHHEYGHAVMWNLYGASDYPPGTGPDPHFVFSESSGGFAMREGWAQFMSCAVDNDPDNLPTAGMNIETNTWFNGPFWTGTGWAGDSGDMDGNIIEGSVASILWDIFDGAGEWTRDTPGGQPVSKDSLSSGFDEIFHIMKDHKPQNMLQFWTHFQSHHPYWARHGLCTIYWQYGIDKDTYPPTNRGITINAGDTYTRSRSVTLTLEAADAGSGVARMRFQEAYSGLGWSPWEVYSTSKSWSLTSPGDGSKEIVVQFMDNKGLTSGFGFDTIILDTTPPETTITRIWTDKRIYKPGENIVIRAKIKEDGVPKTSGTVYARIYAMGSTGKPNYPITPSGGPYVTMTLERAATGKWKGTYGPIRWPGNPLGFQGTYVVMVFVPVPSGPLPQKSTTCFVARTLTESAVAKFLKGESPSRVAVGNNFDVKTRIKNPSSSWQTLKVKLILPAGMTKVTGALIRTITLAPGAAKTLRWTLKSTTATNKLVKINVIKGGTIRAKLHWYIRDP